MDCQTVQEHILESFEETTPEAMQGAVAAHLAGCPRCAAFAARQRTLDARLTTMLVPPEMTPASRLTLRRALRQQPRREWFDATPDILHLAGGALATVVGSVLLPFDASTIVGAGTAATALTYLLLTAVRESFEEADR